MTWTLINTSKHLQNFCHALLKEAPPFIAVDCEFIRQTTYWPELGLIQLATPQQAVIIDPIVHQISLQPLKAILNEPTILKVFHSGRQDIEIFYHLFQECPSPVFDTQIAAAFVGLGEGSGYEKLVYELLQIKIDKGEQFTNWLQRPLSPRQLDYAIHDVLYLKQIYLLLNEHLNNLGRQEWVQESFLHLSRSENYFNNPQDAWKKLNPPFTDWHYLSVLWDLAAWRENYAQSHNISRSFLADNRMLIELSCRPLLTKEDLRKTLLSYRQKIFKVNCFEEFFIHYEQAFTFLSFLTPQLEEREKILKNWQNKHVLNSLTVSQKQKKAQINQEIEKVAHSLNLPISCLATRKDIESFIRSPEAGHKLLSGWRKPILIDCLMENQTKSIFKE
jgi:ribonuclease D